jgi:signal transduction histidine kinase
LERLRPLANERSIQIKCEAGPAEVFGHSDQLDQVLANLLGNAIHYNKPSGEIVVSTRMEDGSAILTIADTGVGIDAKNLPHIFERFYRADLSRSLAQGHTGLGLAICKAIIDAHAGTISVSSQPDIGTTFVVKLPAAG